MLFAEPPRTPYDVRFSIAGVPVRVHPLFWLVALLLGANAIRDVIGLLSWLTAVFVSILIHELGHAMAIRYYGWEPSITLHQLGGLTSYNPRFTPSAASYRRAGNTPLAQIIISAAGPAAGFLFAGAIIVGLFASGQYIDWLFGLRFGAGDPLPPVMGDRFNPVFGLLWDLLLINILWGVINLCPVYPLDGGHIAREIFLVTNGAEGIRQSLILSLVTAAGLALFSLLWGEGTFITALFFGFLAYDSYMMLQSHGPNRFGRGW